MQLDQLIPNSEIESLRNSAVGGLLDSFLGALGHDPDPVRQKARTSLVDFMEYEGRGRWDPEPHLALLCSKLEQVADPEDPLKRLMVFMGPRHGKSEVCSKKFPAWYIGKYPDNYVMITSYAADLSFDFSRIARNTLETETELFPHIRVAQDARAVKHWTISGHVGGLIAAGVGGPIAGRGCNIGIIDDPFKNYEEAQSDTVRESVWQWYLSTFRTRLFPKAGIVLVQTRWHEDDLAGRLLKAQAEGTGEEWEVISYPAIAEHDDPLGRAPGEALSPRYPLEELEPIKMSLGPYLWNALYQQRPRPEEGNYYKVHWMNDSGDVNKLLENYRNKGHFIPIYAAMDYAIGEKDQSNWNVITVGAPLPGDECVLLDRVKFRGDEDADTIAEEMVAIQKKWEPLLWGCEDGQIRKSIWSTVKRKFKAKGQLLNAEFLVPIKDKLARGRTAQGQMRQGQWLFPKDAEWYEDFSEELLGFPNAEFDDQPDSFAWLARLIADVDKTYDPFDLSKCLV